MQDDLNALRQAANERNPEQTQFLLKRILLQMPYYRALAVAVERTYQFAETFERYYPDAKWARKSLVQVTTMGIAPEDIPPEKLRDFTAPGAGNYLKAVSDVGHAARQDVQMEARVGYLVSAVVNAIMAELVEFWYGTRLESWERVRQNRFDPSTGQYTDPDATMIAYQFWTDEQVAARDTQAWLAIADSIEDKLRR